MLGLTDKAIEYIKGAIRNNEWVYLADMHDAGGYAALSGEFHFSTTNAVTSDDETSAFNEHEALYVNSDGDLILVDCAESNLSPREIKDPFNLNDKDGVYIAYIGNILTMHEVKNDYAKECITGCEDDEDGEFNEFYELLNKQ